MKRALTSWPAVLAMLPTAAYATYLNTILFGNGFWNWRGLPFKWYEWHDFGPPFHHYHWWALVLNFVITTFGILLVGLGADRLINRKQK